MTAQMSKKLIESLYERQGVDGPKNGTLVWIVTRGPLLSVTMTHSGETGTSALPGKQCVFIETNTIKLSRNSETLMFPRVQTLRWGDRNITFTVHDIRKINPQDVIGDP